MLDKKFNELCHCLIDFYEKMAELEMESRNLTWKAIKDLEKIERELPLQTYSAHINLKELGVQHSQGYENIKGKLLEWQEKLKEGRKPYTRSQMRSLIKSLEERRKSNDKWLGVVEFRTNGYETSDYRYASHDGYMYDRENKNQLEQESVNLRSLLSHLKKEYEDLYGSA